jgi:3D (Asp-Asp-Asp) domain-containing protein
LIDNDHRPATIVATSALALSFLLGGASGASAMSRHHASSSAPAAAATAAPDPGATVTISQDGVDASFVTHAQTVGAFLAERSITAGAADDVVPARDAPVVDGMHIDYRAAVPVALIVGRERRQVLTTARNVGDFVVAQGIRLGPNDRVEPSVREALRGAAVVRIVRESVWTARSREHIRAGTIHRYDPALPPGTVRTLAGSAGLRELTWRYVQRDDVDMLQRQILATRIVRPPRAKVVLHGIGEYAAFARLAQLGFDATLRLAGNALSMVATAYTASCYGCSGFASNGMRAGHGVVAVDPRIIPLGSRLYIPGYGQAIAGDTGGAIQGRRIDLGFNSLVDALRFGRRAVTVYVLRR